MGKNDLFSNLNRYNRITVETIRALQLPVCQTPAVCLLQQTNHKYIKSWYSNIREKLYTTMITVADANTHSSQANILAGLESPVRLSHLHMI